MPNMSRIALVHRDAQAGAEAARALRRAGHVVGLVSPPGPEALRRLALAPPDAIVIDLDRSPSEGSAVATWLRQRKATRQVPLLFAGGEEAKIVRVRALLPDATYAGWDEVGRSLKTLLRSGRVATAPVVPATMAGYSGTPLAKRLGIREGRSVLLLGAPPGFEDALGSLPEGARVSRSRKGSADVVLAFVRARARLEGDLASAAQRMVDGGRLWIAWAKQSSPLASGLTQSDVRAVGLASGLVDYKICAIDGTWSGLCFARRART
jgi:CheY-like chemotaxis protein